jgi:uncharacterized membrane protein YphA (DoxX/SURF4 family)
MTRSAIVFLILLRLAVGWHFLYEGMLKVRSTRIGPTITNRPFSSAGYFREAPGPLGWAWRSMTGDPDDEALARLEVQPLDDDAEPATDKPQARIPHGLDRDWRDYLNRFVAHYQLDDTQKAQAEAKLDQAEAKVVGWLTYVPPAKPDEQLKDARYAVLTSEQTRTYPSGEVKRRMGMGERIPEYQAKLAEARDAARKNRKLGKDVEGPKGRADRAELARLRAGLLKDLDEQTQEYRKSLDAVLTKDQKAEGPVPEPSGESRLVGWVDLVTQWGLLAIGVCLMAGFFTRTSAWLGAGFLLMTCLAMPSLPWFPAPPNSEGNYLIVNKNVVEMLALCVLATTGTGRWFGLDGLLYRGACWITGKRPEA